MKKGQQEKRLAYDICCNRHKRIGVGVRGERVLSDDFFPDPKDVVFYEVAMSKEEAYLVTGNTKHFPKNPIVVTPAEMLKILQREGSL